MLIEMHWKILGLPQTTCQTDIMWALTQQTMVQNVTPGDFDAQGHLGVTVYFRMDRDTPALRQSLVSLHQTLLRQRLASPDICIEDATRT